VATMTKPLRFPLPQDTGTPLDAAAQMRLEKELQVKLRKLLLKCLSQINIADTRSQPALDHLRSLISEFEQEFGVDVSEARAGKQWLRIKQLLGMAASSFTLDHHSQDTTRGSNEQETNTTDDNEGAARRKRKLDQASGIKKDPTDLRCNTRIKYTGLVPSRGRKSDVGGIYVPSESLQKLPSVVHRDVEIPLTCEACGYVLKSSWFIKCDDEEKVLRPNNGHIKCACARFLPPLGVLWKNDFVQTLTCGHGQLVKNCKACFSDLVHKSTK